MNRLLVVQESSDSPSDWDSETFVLNDETADLDDTRTYEVLRTLYEIDPDSPYSVPMYRILWTHLAANYPDHGSLLELIPLSERLEERVQTDRIDEIVIGEAVQQKYVPLVEDVAENRSCRVRNLSDILLYSRVREVLMKIWNLFVQPCLLLFNQLLSTMLPERSDTRRPVAIFPFPGRYDSTMPIARELGKDASCYVPHLGSDILNWPDVDWNIPLYSYQRHSSFEIIRDETLVFLELLRGKKREEFTLTLCQVLKDELNVDLTRTLRFSVDLVIEHNARLILYYCWALDFLDTEEISAVLVGGPAPRDRAILQAAYERDKDTYYVNHSVVVGNEFLPQPETVYFVPSETGKEHIQDIYSSINIPTLEVTGRPYIEERYKIDDTDPSGPSDDHSEIRVMVATQPYRDEVREKLVQEIDDAADRSPVIDEIRIKLHPSESELYYQDLLGEKNDNDKQITIASSDLEGEIAQASLVVTINSNVGLEAMIQGTPAVCYNEWHPSIQNKPYTRSDRIPVFDDRETLIEFFESLTADNLDNLRRDQTNHAREQFLTRGKAAERIAENIRSSSLNREMG